MDKNKNSENMMLDIDTLLEKTVKIDEKFKKALRQLRKKLPVSWAKTIADTTGKTPIMVYKVMNGECRDKDDTIVLRAIELAEAEVKKITNRIIKIKAI
jgi:hypothetical protein